MKIIMKEELASELRRLVVRGVLWHLRVSLLGKEEEEEEEATFFFYYL
jgi:hypothetical protein